MWLSRQMKAPAPTADADLGMTTITGDSVGVVTRVYLFTPGGNSVYLRSGGEIELRGKVRIQGSLTVNGEPYAPCES